MEDRMEALDGAVGCTDSQRSGRVEADDSLRVHDTNQVRQEQRLQHKKTPPKSTGGKSLQQSMSEQKGCVSASVHRHGFSSGKKRSHTGPLKKRSPKLSPYNPTKRLFRTPLSTPSQTLRQQHHSSNGWSLTSKLTPSFATGLQRETPHQNSIPRNLNKELMKEAIVETPSTVSLARRKPLSSSGVMPSNTNEMTSMTPIPFSFSKKRNPTNPIVTNMSKVNSMKLANTPKKGKSSTTRRSTSAINILRITHPFGDSPRVIIRPSCHRPILSPLAEVTNNPGQLETNCKTQTKGTMIETKHPSKAIRMTTTIPSGLVFSPLLHSPNPVHHSNKSATISSERSDGNEVRLKNKMKTNSKGANTMSPKLNRLDLFRNVPTTLRPCKCKKTNCLKLYCECFHDNTFCDPDICNCRDCMNIEAHNTIRRPRGRRVIAMLSIVAKRPDAFDSGGRRFNPTGCRCKKSRYVTIQLFLVFCCFLLTCHTHMPLSYSYQYNIDASRSSVNALHRDRDATKRAPALTAKTIGVVKALLPSPKLRKKLEVLRML